MAQITANDRANNQRKPPMKLKFRTRTSLVVSVLLTCMGIFQVQAADVTWSGAGADDTFTDGNNRGATAPSLTGNRIFFDGGIRLTPTNNLADDAYTFNGITFNSGAGSFARQAGAWPRAQLHLFRQPRQHPQGRSGRNILKLPPAVETPA